MTDHPITPPPELVAQIRSDALRKSSDVLDYELRMIHAAYRAGADQELEACVQFLSTAQYGDTFGWYSLKQVAVDLRADRRPKPPSLKEQALMALEDGDLGPGASLTPVEVCIIRRALEQLDD